jgi:hypothetical protein
MHNVRLSKETVLAIQKAFQNFFLVDDRLWVFCSRADLSKKAVTLIFLMYECEICQIHVNRINPNAPY